MDDRPFRGSAAIARGVLTRGDLRSGRYHQVFRDVYVAASGEPLDLTTRSCAAFLLVERTGALAGYSAAELLGTSCGPRDAPAEIVSVGTGIRPRPGLVVHRDRLPDTDVWTAQGCRVTHPLRTAWDLARRLELTEAVVAVDALARRGRFDPSLLLASCINRPGRRGSRRLGEIVSLADQRAESPMETRLRLLLLRYGLPPPAVQFELLDAYGFVLARFDLAYPGLRLAIEYDGVEPHRQRRIQDNRRDMAVAELSWETMRFGYEDVWDTPRHTAERVHRMITARQRLLIPAVTPPSRAVR